MHSKKCEFGFERKVMFGGNVSGAGNEAKSFLFWANFRQPFAVFCLHAEALSRGQLRNINRAYLKFRYFGQGIDRLGAGQYVGRILAKVNG